MRQKKARNEKYFSKQTNNLNKIENQNKQNKKNKNIGKH